MRNIVLFSATATIAFFITVESPAPRVPEDFEPAAPIEMPRVGLLLPDLWAREFGIL
jgi:hypothetical protein